MLIGRRLGPYEVLGKLGEGGMGEVYRARDPRLNREVAVKVLPAAFASDAERLRRFEQEAHVVAALSHPNIVPVYDVGSHDGAPYLVSELVEGETLRARLSASGRPLPARAAVELAAQIARGLAAAHAKGVVHRDLKPENLVIGADGRIRILDFGLARLAPMAADSGSMATIGGTDAGTVLGTVGYMAPEQVRGQPVDHRGDIFALGAVLYEMLSGRRAFAGASSADTMSAILHDDPEPVASGNHAPEALRRIVDRCLEKQPSARFQSADDLAFALDSIATRSDTGAVAARPAGRNRAWLPAMAAVALLLAVAAAFLYGSRRPPGDGVGPARLYLPTPDGLTFPLHGLFNYIAVSPDGRRIALAANDASGTSWLWLRRLDSEDVLRLPGTEGARAPFWSPDGRFIAFFSTGALRKVPVDGGAVQPIVATTSVPTGGTWSQDDVILFSLLYGPILRVPAAGGEPAPVTRFEPRVRADERHSFPHFLPDGRRFLFYARNADLAANGIYLRSLDSDEERLILNVSSTVAYVEPGFLVYAKDGALLAHPFDPERGTLTGDPTVIAGRVDHFVESGIAVFHVSGSGVLIYRGSPQAPLNRLKWMDRRGEVLGEIGEPRQYRNPRLSPDGKRLAVELPDPAGNRDIHLMDVSRGVPTRFTFAPGRNAAAVWSRPDGLSLAWQGETAVYLKPSSGSGPAEAIHDEPWIPDDWLPDGSGLLAHPFSPRQVWLVPLNGERKPTPVIEGKQITTHARVSPRGDWVAFSNTDSGQFEVWLQDFPAPSGRWKVSAGGGIQPKWRADQRELFYLGMDGTLMSVSLTLGPLPEIGKPSPLFQTRIEANTGLTWHQYDVTPDGQRFLVNAPDIATSPLTVVLDWPALIRR